MKCFQPITQKTNTAWKMTKQSHIKKDIANKFKYYFTNIGQTTANSFSIKGNTNYSHYLNKQVNSVFTLKNVVEKTVKRTIANLLTQKNCCGFNGISSKLLQLIEFSIIKSPTLLINKLLNTGLFSDKLNVSKVIPILKHFFFNI